MENKLNLVEILKDCPKGMELYSPLCGDCKLYDVNDYNIKIEIPNKDSLIILRHDGTYYVNGEIMLFPKGKTSWEGFHRPFKNGDVLFVDCSDDEDKSYQYIFILNKPEFYGKWHSHCHLDGVGHFHSKETYLTDDEYHPRFATEEEKEKLFDAIKANGHRWDDETKTLEKLTPKFKDGDIIFTNVDFLKIGLGNAWISIFKENSTKGVVVTYAGIKEDGSSYYDNTDEEKGVLCLCNDIVEQRFATEEEKEKLFQAIKDNGYRWDDATKTLEKLTPKFKDGDIVATKSGLQVFILQRAKSNTKGYCYIGYDFEFNEFFDADEWEFDRLATEEERQKLLKAIEDDGYTWDPETKTLEKIVPKFIPKFKDGDVVSIPLSTGNAWIGLFKQYEDDCTFTTHCFINGCGEFIVKSNRCKQHSINNVHIATEEEKVKLFETIKANGYKWDDATKTLEKLTPKFKDGDVVAAGYYESTQLFLLKHVARHKDGHINTGYCYFGWDFYYNRLFEEGDWGFSRLATEEEKAKLFETIKANGYKWDDTTKTLEKLAPKFKVGDKIQNKENEIQFTITKIHQDCYECDDRYVLTFENQDNWDLVPNKFDINSLVPFESRVLVRDYSYEVWRVSFWGCLVNSEYGFIHDTTRGCYKQCIPYEGNEHLLGKTDNCDSFYKNWK